MNDSRRCPRGSSAARTGTLERSPAIRCDTGRPAPPAGRALRRRRNEPAVIQTPLFMNSSRTAVLIFLNPRYSWARPSFQVPGLRAKPSPGSWPMVRLRHQDRRTSETSPLAERSSLCAFIHMACCQC
jgi:hypothetical protein